MSDKTIVEMARPLVNEELQEVLNNYEKARNKKSEKALADIQEVVDKIRSEVAQIGKDQIDNTHALEDLDNRFETFRKTLNKRDEKHQDNTEQIVKDATKETVRVEIPKVIERVVEPHKRSLRGTHPSFWKRIKLMAVLGKGGGI